MKEVGVALPIPEEGLVYDYRVEDGGLFSDKKSEGEEEEEKGKAKTKVSFIVEMTCIV